MELIESELGRALHGSVKRKANNTENLRIAARRVTARSTEVMVKVTGFGKGAGHVKAHLNYISRNGKVELENDRGEIFTGKEQVNNLLADCWEKDFCDSKRHKNQRDTMHLVLSMPQSTDAQCVRRAVRQFAKSTFGKNHEYVFALHTDERHPHCHLAVQCLGFDGTRLNPRKADLQAWREGFAEKLRGQGIDAVATPRRARGVVRKAEANVIRHIERGDKSHAPRISRVRAAKVKEAALELMGQTQGLAATAKPWEQAIKARQRQIRSAWLAAADALEQENPRLTFNQKEARNERPNYGQISAARVREGQPGAAVYQSNLEKSGHQAPAGTIASVRNLSGLDLVHDARASQMLLRPNAPDRLGRAGAADSQMRRARTGDCFAGAGQERPVDDEHGERGGALENKALAQRIRAFVQDMPGIDTERHQIKRDLAQRFTRQAHQARDSGREATPLGSGQKNGLDQAGPEQAEEDAQR